MSARLHFKNGPLAGTSIELGSGTHTVGRTPENSLQIADDSVSSNHCRLDVSSIGVVVTDLNSTNGCFINGTPLRQGSLPPKSTLGIGSILIEVELPEVSIVVPDMSPAPPPEPNLLEDGSPACRKHPQVAAPLVCTKCGETWCFDCVRQVGLSGSKNVLRFCAVCDGRCQAIDPIQLGSGSSILGKIKKAFGWKQGRRR